jgi:hypothetical protein
MKHKAVELLIMTTESLEKKLIGLTGSIDIEMEEICRAQNRVTALQSTTDQIEEAITDYRAALEVLREAGYE